jgi:nucleoside 2-deoxyribosyltransferase
MKAFVAYRHTGEDPVKLRQYMSALQFASQQSGLEYYCTYFDENVFQDRLMGPRDIMHHAFNTIKNECDFLLVILASDEKSEGMLMEVGYCIANNIPVVVVVSTEVQNSYLPELANQVFWWTQIGELEEALTRVDIRHLVK